MKIFFFVSITVFLSICLRLLGKKDENKKPQKSLFLVIRENIRNPAVIIILVLVIFLVNVVVYMVYIDSTCGQRLNSAGKDIYSTYAYVYNVKREYSKPGGYYVEANTIIRNRKYKIFTGVSPSYPFIKGGFYSVRFWCKNIRCATLDWSSEPIDTAIVNAYFRKYNIDFYQTTLAMTIYQPVPLMAFHSGV